VSGKKEKTLTRLQWGELTGLVNEDQGMAGISGWTKKTTTKRKGGLKKPKKSAKRSLGHVEQ